MKFKLGGITNVKTSYHTNHQVDLLKNFQGLPKRDGIHPSHRLSSHTYFLQNPHFLKCINSKILKKMKEFLKNMQALDL